MELSILFDTAFAQLTFDIFNIAKSREIRVNIGPYVVNDSILVDLGTKREIFFFQELHFHKRKIEAGFRIN